MEITTEETNPKNSTGGEIQQFYEHKNIFLTGGTGFLGKLIIEKLLRTTDVSTIYTIIRSKKNRSFEERCRDLLEHEIFSQVRQKVGKIKIFEGDLKKLNLGLSNENRKSLEEEVDIIIHCGAAVSMAASIKDNALSNVRSTREILAIAKKCRKLVSFLYISTAYSNCPQSVIEEKFFEPPINPDLLISMSEEIEDDTLQRISAGLGCEWPNSYVFTKAVSENIVMDAAKTLPVAILRPSIVVSTADEPIKGWTDNLYGPLGFLLSINLGILRILLSDSSIRLDIVPADKVVNAILCLAWETEQQWNKAKGIDYKPPILNFCGRESGIYVNLISLYRNCKVAMKAPIWYPMCFFVYNPLIFIVLDKLFHRVPYYILDKIAICKGKKPLATRSFNNVSRACITLYYFMVNEWTIKNDNVVALWNKLSDVDKNLYDFDVTKINPDDYFQSLAMGLKKYLAKEDITDIDQHEKRLMRLKSIHYFTIGVIMTTIFAMISASFILMFKYIT